MRRRIGFLLSLCLAPEGGCQPEPSAGTLDQAATRDAAAVDLASFTPVGPDRLSETGLYADVARRALAPGVFRFTPRFPTWTDGTVGDAFLLLPPGTTIDTTDMDRWTFPLGTKAWREVRAGDLLLETRYLEKQRAGARGWFAMGYAWDAEHTDATARPDGARDVLGTGYDVLDAGQCARCHDNARDALLAVSAVQLSRAGGGGPLSQLAAGGLLSRPPASELVVPGTPVEQAALGYLHGNCGHCHAADSLLRTTLSLNLDLRVADRRVADTAAYRTALNARMFHPMPPDIDLCVVPGDPEKSQLFARMARRDDWAMPNLDTELVDGDGVALIRAWIESLPR